MARTPKPKHQKLAEALEAAKKAAGQGHILQKKSLSLTHVKTLNDSGWILELYAGWIALVTPGAREGDTVPYFSNYWEFIRKYLDGRLGNTYILSPLASIALHTDSHMIPKQLAVTTTRTTQGPIELPHDTNLMVISDPSYDLSAETIFDGLRILSLERAIAAMPASSYRMPTSDLMAAIASVRNIPELSRWLLRESGFSAARVIGAMNEIGRGKDALVIENAFKAAGIDIPPQTDSGSFGVLGGTQNRIQSGIIARLKVLWQQMSSSLSQGPVPVANLEGFQRAPIDEIKKTIDEAYTSDAYNSLSIEGYQVTPALIERVASGNWDPEKIKQDKETESALAARGYFEAFNAAVDTIIQVRSGAPLVEIIETAALDWRGHLFSPAAKAGILPVDSLAGYRYGPVYIRGSSHVPPPHEKLMDAMDTFYDLLRAEPNAWAKAVLGHFFFVYIHPFPDGNGRTARFLMNAILVTTGYPWVIVRVSQREKYFTALEKASINGDILALSDFLSEEMAAAGKN